jgi:hypothetical protein
MIEEIYRGTRMTKKEAAITKINEAIGGINDQLNVPKLDETDPVYRNQLLMLKSILKVMHEELTLPPRTKIGCSDGLGRIITDSWSFENPLGEIILDAEHSFIEALKEI